MRGIPQDFNRIVANAKALSDNRSYRANDVWRAIKDIEILKEQPYIKNVDSAQAEFDRALSMYYQATKSINDGSIRNFDQEKSALDIAANAMEKALNDYVGESHKSDVGIKVEPSWHEDDLDRDLKKIVYLSPYDAPDPRASEGRYRGGQATPAERPAENGYGWELWMTFNDDPDTIYIIGRIKDSFNTYEDAISFIQRYYPSFSMELNKESFSDRLFNGTSATPQLEGKNPRYIYRSYPSKAILISPPSDRLLSENSFIENYDKDLDGLLEDLRRNTIRLSIMFRKPIEALSGMSEVRKSLSKWLDTYLIVNSYSPKMLPAIKRSTIQIRKLKQKLDAIPDGHWIPSKALTDQNAKAWVDFWVKAIDQIKHAQSVLGNHLNNQSSKNVVQVVSAPSPAQYPSPSEAIYTSKGTQFKTIKSAIVGALKDSAIELYKIATSDHVIYDVDPVLDNLNKVIALKESMLDDSDYFQNDADKDRFRKQIKFAKDLEADLESGYAEIGYVPDDIHRLLESFADDEISQARKIIQSSTKFYVLESIAGWIKNVVGTIVGVIRVFTKIFGDILKAFSYLLYQKSLIFVWQMKDALQPYVDRLDEAFKDYQKSISQFRESKRLREIGEEINLSGKRAKVALSELQKLGNDRAISRDVFKRVVKLIVPNIADNQSLKDALEEAAAGEVSKVGNVPMDEAENFVMTGDIPDSVIRDIESAFNDAGIEIEGHRIRDIDALFHNMDIPDEDEIKKLYNQWNNFEKIETPDVPMENRTPINDSEIDKMFDQKKALVRQNILYVLLADTTYDLLLKFIESHPSTDIAKKFDSLMTESMHKYQGTMDAEPALEALIDKNKGYTNIGYFDSILRDARSKFDDDKALQRGEYIYNRMSAFIKEATKPKESQSNEFRRVFADVIGGTGKPSDSGEKRAHYYANQYSSFLSMGIQNDFSAITDEVIRYLAENFISNLSDKDWEYLITWIDEHKLLDFSNLR